MAISKMAKLIIISHRSEASELLEALQREGICQILNAEEAMVCKDWPELSGEIHRPKEIEELLGRLVKSITFLKEYGETAKGLAAALSPRTVIDQQEYDMAVSDKQLLDIVHQSEQTENAIAKLNTDSENLGGTLETLRPWAGMETPVEQINQLETVTCITGLLATQQLEQLVDQQGGLGAAIQQVGIRNNQCACLIACLKEQASDVQKLLRSMDFEQVNFESMTGTVAELIRQHEEELDHAKSQLKSEYEKAKSLSKNLLKLQILCDHYANLLDREQTKGAVPTTDSTVILEGWVRQRDYKRLEKTVSGFGASSVSKIAPAEGEEIPVEIENENLIKPFEMITRLYGMPQHFEVDPTIFLAPFFALFFALCLTDAGYGLVIIGLMAFFIKKVQGDKKLMWMLGICSAVTVVTGALTGGWFGDAIQKFVPVLEPAREKLMWFDPFEKPMWFFALSLTIGYIHLLTGICIAFVHNIKQKHYVAAICDQLTWLVMLNSILLFGVGKGAVIPPEVGSFFGKLALVPAVIILLFSQREGGWGGRLGMGAYNLFSTIFYLGDVLSYLRLMALGMVTAGLGMAINVIAKITLDIPYIGFVVMIVVLVGGHAFNLGLSTLSAFVHTLRLQYVEFFPKFLVGGGRLFVPLAKEYKHVYIKEQ